MCVCVCVKLPGEGPGKIRRWHILLQLYYLEVKGCYTERVMTQISCNNILQQAHFSKRLGLQKTNSNTHQGSSTCSGKQTMQIHTINVKLSTFNRH